VRARALTPIVAALLLGACRVGDAAGDRRALAEAVAARASVAAFAAEPAAAGPDDEVLALLRTPLDADAAVRIALRNNRRVQAAFERLGVARADLEQASRLRNPVFDGSARFLLDGGTELELGLAVPFVDLFHRPLRARIAEHEFAAVQTRLVAELVQLVFAVRRALVHAQAAEQLAALRRAELVAGEAAHELAANLYAAGNFTDRQLAEERIHETRARLALAAAEHDAAAAREPLQRLLGLWGAATEWTLEGPLASDPLQGLDLAHAENRAIAASLLLAAHRQRLEALAQKARLRSWQQWFPDGSAGLSGVREPGGDWGLGPQATVELPVLDDGSAASARAAHELRAALHEYAQLAVEVRSAARMARDRAAHLAALARFQREAHLPQRHAVVHATVQEYNAMQIGAFEVLEQRRQQLADEREHVATLRDAHLARLDLEELFAGGPPQRHETPPAADDRRHDGRERP
jgi:outer membrane protein TolC